VSYSMTPGLHIPPLIITCWCPPIMSQHTMLLNCFFNASSWSSTPQDSENGSWNCLDFFVVIVGFVEMSPLAFVFEAFPVVVLRLLRLLRVFRLAKALPRLRSIVEALISGFSAVGWICVLIIVFNYITACMLMLAFRENDPFHFGAPPRISLPVAPMLTLSLLISSGLLSLLLFHARVRVLTRCISCVAYARIGRAVHVQRAAHRDPRRVGPDAIHRHAGLRGLPSGLSHDGGRPRTLCQPHGDTLREGKGG